MSEVLTATIGRPCKDLIGGVQKVYLFPYVKYSRTQITIIGQEVTSFPTTTAFEVYSSSTNFSESTEIEGGDVLWNQSFTIEVPKTAFTNQLYRLVKQDYRAIFVDRIGNARILGLYNGLEASVTNETGTDKASFNGYKVSFTGKEARQALWMRGWVDTGGGGIDVSPQNLYLFQDGNYFLFQDGNNYIFN